MFVVVEFVVCNKKTVSLYFVLGICPQKCPGFRYCSIMFEMRVEILFFLASSL